MKFEERPWGSYTVLHTDENCQVKLFVINPGKRFSLQSHNFRAEHWFIVSGVGNAHLDGKEVILGLGISLDIPIGAQHQISCDEVTPCFLLKSR